MLFVYQKHEIERLAMPIKFYRECNEPYGCFSNFSKHSFEVNGTPWQTVEQHHAGPALRFPAAILRPC